MTWEKRKFSTIAKLTKGISYTSSDYCGKGEGAIFVTLKCIAKDGGFSNRGIKYFKGFIPKVQLLKANDLLFANTDLTRNGDIVGCPVYLPDLGDDFPITMSMDLSRVDFIDESIDAEFIYYQLMTDKVRRFMKENSSGSTVLHLNTSKVYDLEINIPTSKTEQKRIAQILSTADEAIEQTQRLIDKYNRIKRGLMQDLLTRGIDENGNIRNKQTHKFTVKNGIEVPDAWEVDCVGNLFEMILGKMLNKTARAGENQFPYLANRNVLWGKIDFSNLETMRFNDFEREKLKLETGDLLVCEGGAIGRTAIWKNEFQDCYFQKAIHRLRPKKNKILPEFMLEYMMFADLKGYFADLSSQTSIAHLTQEKLALLNIPLPCLAEQKKIVNLIEQNNRMILIEENKLTKLQAIKKGLMQDLLSGKKRVKCEE